MDEGGNKLLIICNFSANTQKNYKIGVPNKGNYTEIFSTDDEEFGGKGIKNEKLTAKAGKIHGRKQYLELTLPAFSTIFILKKAGSVRHKETEL